MCKLADLHRRAVTSRWQGALTITPGWTTCLGIVTLNVVRQAFLCLSLAVLVTGCAAVESPSSPSARADKAGKEAGVGFTVPENVEADADVAADFEAAIRHFNAGEYKEGVALMKKVSERSSSHTAPHINLAMAYQKMNKLPAAEESIKEALKLNPAHPVANTEYGLIYRKTGRFAEARAAYERALAGYPDYLPARKNLGILCDIYLRDLECALKQYRIYSAAMPEDKTVQIWIADLERRQGQ